MEQVEAQSGFSLEVLSDYFRHISGVLQRDDVTREDKEELRKQMPMADLLLEMEGAIKGSMDFFEFFRGQVDDAVSYYKKVDANLSLKHVPYKERIIQVLQEVVDSFVLYNKKQAFLSKILSFQGGNCQARALYVLSVVREVYPELDLFYDSIVEADEDGNMGPPHARVLFSFLGEKKRYVLDAKTKVEVVSDEPIFLEDPEIVILGSFLDKNLDGFSYTPKVNPDCKVTFGGGGNDDDTWETPFCVNAPRKIVLVEGGAMTEIPRFALNEGSGNSISAIRTQSKIAARGLIRGLAIPAPVMAAVTLLASAVAVVDECQPTPEFSAEKLPERTVVFDLNTGARQSIEDEVVDLIDELLKYKFDRREYPMGLTRPKGNGPVLEMSEEYPEFVNSRFRSNWPKDAEFVQNLLDKLDPGSRVLGSFFDFYNFFEDEFSDESVRIVEAKKVELAVVYFDQALVALEKNDVNELVDVIYDWRVVDVDRERLSEIVLEDGFSDLWFSFDMSQQYNNYDYRFSSRYLTNVTGDLSFDKNVVSHDGFYRYGYKLLASFSEEEIEGVVSDIMAGETVFIDSGLAYEHFVERIGSQKAVNCLKAQVGRALTIRGGYSLEIMSIAGHLYRASYIGEAYPDTIPQVIEVITPLVEAVYQEDDFNGFAGASNYRNLADLRDALPVLASLLQEYMDKMMSHPDFLEVNKIYFDPDYEYEITSVQDVRDRTLGYSSGLKNLVAPPHFSSAMANVYLGIEDDEERIEFLCKGGFHGLKNVPIIPKRDVLPEDLDIISGFSWAFRGEGSSESWQSSCRVVYCLDEAGPAGISEFINESTWGEDKEGWRGGWNGFGEIYNPEIILRAMFESGDSEEASL